MLSSPLKLPQNQQVEEKPPLERQVASRSDRRQQDTEQRFKKALADSQQQQNSTERRQKERQLEERQVEDRQRVDVRAERRQAKQDKSSGPGSQQEARSENKPLANSNRKPEPSENTNEKAVARAKVKEAELDEANNQASKNARILNEQEGKDESSGPLDSELTGKQLAESDSGSVTNEILELEQEGADTDTWLLEAKDSKNPDSIETGVSPTSFNEQTSSVNAQGEILVGDDADSTGESLASERTVTGDNADKATIDNLFPQNATTAEQVEKELKPSADGNEVDGLRLADELELAQKQAVAEELDLVAKPSNTASINQNVNQEYREKEKTDWLDNLIKIVNFAKPDSNLDSAQNLDSEPIGPELAAEQKIAEGQDSELDILMRQNARVADETLGGTAGEVSSLEPDKAKLIGQNNFNQDTKDALDRQLFDDNRELLIRQQVAQALSEKQGVEPAAKANEFGPTNIPSHIALKMMQGAGNSQGGNGQTAYSGQNGQEMVADASMLSSMLNAGPNEDGIKLDNDPQALSELRQAVSIQSANLATGVGGDSGIKSTLVEVQGVQLDRTLVAPKLESIAQAKHEAMIKENVLFNKQELAANVQQQVGLMMARNLKSVDIRLDPPELGSMQIKLNISNEQAAVSFVVSSQQAKDALEGSLPKLRELLEQQGMELADADVKQESRQGGDGHGSDEEPGHSALGENTEEELENVGQTTTAQQVNSPWNVDYYA